MPSTSLVSVVIPVYNGGRYLAETLDAVGRQRHASLEVIVVDDGSTDDSVTTLEHCERPVRLLHTPRVGVGAARNAGLAAARGQLICFLDQDDVWYDDHLERQIKCLDQHPEIGVVVSPYLHWYPDSDGRYPSPTQVLPTPCADTLDPAFTGWVYHQFLLDCWALTSATLLRREVVETCGGFDPAQPYGEDWELWLRLSREVQFAKLNWPPVLYRQHAVQGSRHARPTDYRSELLLAAAQAHGVSRADGRGVPHALFQRTVARYQMEFGYHHLQAGDAAIGIRALLRAWRRNPTALRYLALAAAARAGWRPKPPGLHSAARHPAGTSA